MVVAIGTKTGIIYAEGVCRVDVIRTLSEKYPNKEAGELLPEPMMIMRGAKK